MKTRWSASRALLLFFASILLSACATQKAEVKVMSSGGFTAAYKELTPEFERKTKHTVVTSYGASMGGAPDSIPSRIARGEPVDVVILADAGLENLIKQGKVEPDSRVDLARSSIGMAVRAGAPKPDISTVEALKRTLLEAKSIAYSASASGTYLSTVLFKQLGVYDQVKDKAKRIESERVGTVVARGDAEIGFQQVSELLPIAGIDYVGPIPAELQQYAVFSAGIAVQAKEAAAGRELVQFLCSPGSAPTIKKTGPGADHLHWKEVIMCTNHGNYLVRRAGSGSPFADAIRHRNRARVSACGRPCATAEGARADDVHQQQREHACGSGSRVSPGRLDTGTHLRPRAGLHQRLAVVRRQRRTQPGLGAFEIPLEHREVPHPHRHIFGRPLLGPSLSGPSLVLEP